MTWMEMISLNSYMDMWFKLYYELYYINQTDNEVVFDK